MARHPLTNAFLEGRDKFKKKEVGKYFNREKNPNAACHVGAIYWGVFKRVLKPNGSINDLAIEYPVIRTKVLDIPCEHHDPDPLEDFGSLAGILIHLNDEHDGRQGWTNEKIADWMDQSLTSGPDILSN